MLNKKIKLDLYSIFLQSNIIQAIAEYFYILIIDVTVFFLSITDIFWQSQTTSSNKLLRTRDLQLDCIQVQVILNQVQVKYKFKSSSQESIFNLNLIKFT